MRAIRKGRISADGRSRPEIRRIGANGNGPSDCGKPEGGHRR